MLKRITLFVALNILIIATVTIILNLLGVDGYMRSSFGTQLNYSALAIFCLVWGMVGSFISLMISKWMAKTFMGVQILNPQGPEGELVNIVHNLAKGAGLSKMPEVGVYNGQDVNAFATGPGRNNSLVAVSQGALSRLNRDQLTGVLGHEVAHIANGDMVTMALLQGVLNAFVMFFARIAAFAVSQILKDDDEGEGLGYFAHFMLVMLFQVIFGILASIPLAWFSRIREYKADIGGAKLAGSSKMIAALEGLQRAYPQLSKANNSMKSMQISSKTNWIALFSTHPPLEDRIERLKKNFY